MHEASAVAHQTKRLLGGPLYFMAASSIYAVILAMWLPEGVWAACAGALRACAPLPDVIPFPLLLHVFMLQCHSCRTMPVKLSWVLTGCFCLHAGGSCSWDVQNSRGHRPCMAAFALLGSPSSKVGSLQAWFNYGLYLMSIMTLLAYYAICREVWRDGLANGVGTAHSIVLCFMVGPVGILSHLMTKGLIRARRARWKRVQSTCAATASGITDRNVPFDL